MSLNSEKKLNKRPRLLLNLKQKSWALVLGYTVVVQFSTEQPKPTVTSLGKKFSIECQSKQSRLFLTLTLLKLKNNE